MDLVLMATSYCKILETIETLAEELELTLGICLNLVNSFLRYVQVWDNFKKCARVYFAFNFFGYNFAPTHQRKKGWLVLST